MNKYSPSKKKKKKLGSYPQLTVIFSITISLFVIGLFAILFLHANKLSKVIQENIELHVYLDNNLDDTDVDSLKFAIGSLPYILKRNNTPEISYISQEDAAKKFIEETGEDFSLVLNENPLRRSFIVKIYPAFYEDKQIKEVADHIKNMPGVFEVDYPVNLIKEINKNIKTISIILIFFSVLLLVTTILLINNTIKLALFSQRFLIRSMQLVGAKSSFIQQPFLWRATIQGFIGGVIAVSLLAVMVEYAYTEVVELQRLKEIEKMVILFLGIIVLGILIGLLSSYRAISRYLEMSLDELY